jgi:signal transduction histidine kinase
VQQTIDAAATGVQQAIDATFATTARRWERILTMVRVVLCAVMFVRGALIWHFAPAVVGPMLIGAVLYIAGSVAVTRSSAPIERLLRISVLLDTATAFVSLLGNVARPWLGYDGVVNTPDIAVLAMATLAGGLRLSPRTAVFSAVLNAACFATLLALDRLLYGLPSNGGYYQYVLQGSFLASAAAMGIVVAVRTRKLAERAVRTALTAERAQRSFGALLHEHHDVRTLLSAVRLNADRLAGERVGGGGNAIDDLRSDLDDVEARIHAIYARACGELSALDVRQRVDVGVVARDVLERLGRHFPGSALVLRGEPHVEAEVAGGGATVRRMLFNLVVNACEGDGERGPRRVEVTVRGDRVARRVWIDVADDGPGFARDILDAAPDEVRSTKPGGSGFGLAVVRSLAKASDGTLRCGNREAGGAWASLSLPFAQ